MRFRSSSSRTPLKKEWVSPFLRAIAALSGQHYKELVERFYYASGPRQVALIDIPLALILTLVGIRDSTWAQASVCLGTGLIAWTFVEYLLHRFAFHWKPKRPLFKKFVYISHLRHHLEPQNRTLYNAGPWLSFPFAALLYLATALMSGSWTWAALFMAGLLMGHVIYEWLHSAAHSPDRKSRVLRYLKSYHLSHHHKDWSRRFGVTSPFWDLVFGTK